MKTTRNYAGSYTIEANGREYLVERVRYDHVGHDEWVINDVTGGRSPGIQDCWVDTVPTLGMAKDLIEQRA
jgi:hypothetical protein